MTMIITNVKTIDFRRLFSTTRYQSFKIKNLILKVQYSNKNKNDYNFKSKIQG